jgi:sortase A
VVKYVPFDGLTWLIGGLKQEIAWMGDTSWPGLGGNTALAGHVTLATGADGPFRYLELLEQGDQVTLYTDVNEYIYKVREKVVVEDTDFSVLAQGSDTLLTLITCTEFDPGTGFYSRRLVVVADLVEARPLEAAYHGN